MRQKVIQILHWWIVSEFPWIGSGTPSANDNCMESEIEKTTTLIKKLSKIAKTSQQNAYSCFSKVVQIKLSFSTRTTPEALKKMDEIEKNAKQQLLPSISGKNYLTDEDRSFFCSTTTNGRIKPPE